VHDTSNVRVTRPDAPVIVQLMPPPDTESALPVSVNTKFPKLIETAPNAQ
jgi:hypothetical protein